MATRNFVPRSSEEGNVGTQEKLWLKGWFKDVEASGKLTGDVISGSAFSASGGYFGTASYSSRSLTSSFSITSSYALSSSAATSLTFVPLTASYAVSSSTSINTISASFANTASYAVTSVSSSYAHTSSFAASSSYVYGIIASSVMSGSFLSGTYTFPADLNIDGTLRVRKLIAEYVTESYSYLTGSTKFGDASSDTHQFTGSVSISGSLTVVGTTSIPTASYANTASYAANGATAIIAISASLATTASYAQTSQFQVDVKRRGFLNGTETTLYFDGSSSFTLAPIASSGSWTYYREGIRTTILGSVSIPVSSSTPAQSGSYNIYIDSFTGALTSSTIPLTLLDDKVPVVTVYWDNTRSPKWWMADERHTVVIDPYVNYIEHLGGLEYVNGGMPSGYVTESNVNADCTFAISQTTVSDQDILHVQPALPKPNGTSPDYVTYYHKNATEWVWATSSMPFVYTGSSYIQWDNNGVMKDGVGSNFYNSYLLYTNISGSARYVIIPGQHAYNTLPNALLEDPLTFNMTGFNINESILAYQLTWQTALAFTNSGKVELASVPKRLNIPVISSIGVSSTTDHNSLANLQGGSLTERYHLTAPQHNTLGVSSSYATTASYATMATVVTSSIVYITSASYATVAGAVDPFNVMSGSFLSGTYTFPADVSIEGTLRVRKLIAEYVTESYSFLTGSTKFGDASSDTHQFTGSVSISGSLTVVGTTSIPTASYATTSSFAVTSSYSTQPASFARGETAGSVPAPSTTGTMTVIMSASVITITPTGNCTFNASGGVTGQLTTFAITAGGTPSRTLTWGTNFVTTGTLATGTTAARYFAVTFRCVDGTSWWEIGRTAVMT